MDKPADHKGHRQRLKNRFEMQLSGGQPLSESELSELLLTYAIPRRDVAPAAQMLLQRFGSLQNALNATAEELASVPGVSDSTALFLKLVGSITKEKTQAPAVPAAAPSQTLVLTSLAAAASHCQGFLRGRGEELLLQVLIGEDSRVLSSCFITGGGRQQVALPADIILQNARVNNACGVVLAHNHPSGDSRPSPADVAATRQAAALLGKNGFRLLEHFVVTENGCFAMLHELTVNAGPPAKE